MKTIACSIAALLVAAPAFAQTPPQTRPSDSQALTRALNAAPPATTVAPATRSTGVTAPDDARAPATAPRNSAPTTPQPTPTPAPVAPAARPALRQPSSSAEPPASRAAGPGAPVRPVPASASPPGRVAAGAPAAAAPIASVVPAPPAAPAPALPAVLNAAAIARLPFTVILPVGFQITAARPGPDFQVYTVRRGTQPFVMIYAGPTSQFPIYSGDVVQAAGRASVVTVEGNQRRAVEHLFQRTQSPTEIHIWVSSLDGADRSMAEQIAQSVDVR